MPINIYKRFYVVFNQEDRGCSIEGKEVSGYLKVEFRGNRGRITAALQNLNPAYSYNVKLLKSNGEVTVVDFGAIKVDDKGRGGGEWTFNGDDVKDSGISWEEFSVAFIEAHDGIKTLVPLASVINKKTTNWKVVYKKYLSKVKGEETPAEKSDKNDREIKQEETDTATPQGYESTENETEKGETSQNVLEEVQSETPAFEETSEALTDSSDTQQPETSFNFEEEVEEGYIKYLREYVNNIVSFLEEVEPFEKNFEGYRWWKVKTGYREGGFDHYLVGFVNDEKGELKYIVYGMPGFFTLADQPFGGMTGFVVWKPVKENLRGARDEGYWILHIDAKTGQIAVPIEPTPPPLI
ncbi:MAG: hypothetical protein PWP18_1252 [Thermoanaerobacter sp.]|nr:hypothetical protein [Thermoanaerobacter sp.]